MQLVRQRPIATLILASALLMVHHEAHAIRPFITDDARVVGARLGQVESWIGANRQESAHNTLLAIGPTNWLEITGISLRRANALMSGRRLESFITLRQPILIRVVPGPSR